MATVNGAMSLSAFGKFQPHGNGRAFSESPNMSSSDWNDEFGRRTQDSSSWNRTNYRSTRSKFGSSRSAPLLDAAHTSHATTWYASSPTSRLTSSQESPMWKPLGSKWREWDHDECGSPIRQNVDQGSTFLHGTIPKWNKGQSMRKLHVLEHELTWTYYRIKRHALHPQRQEVGDPHLPQDCVVEKMRSGSENKFEFWRDLKPPFIISSVKRQVDEQAGNHPDGDVFHIQYHCGIDYVGERLWNEKSDGGTFDNKIHGIAQVRIPDGFPRCGKPIKLLSWGSPSLVWSPHKEEAEEKGADSGMVDPNKWMPIADELHLRADANRFAACREATKRAVTKRTVEVQPLQKMLLGPHSSLTKNASQRVALDDADASRRANFRSSISGTEGTSQSPSKKKRQHTIFTSAAGFVRYVG